MWVRHSNSSRLFVKWRTFLANKAGNVRLVKKKSVPLFFRWRASSVKLVGRVRHLGRSSRSVCRAPNIFFDFIWSLFPGTVGNTVTVWVISKNPRMHSGGTNYYLINLAISDLISLILGLPFEVYVSCHNLLNLACVDFRQFDLPPMKYHITVLAFLKS